MSSVNFPESSATKRPRERDESDQSSSGKYIRLDESGGRAPAVATASSLASSVLSSSGSVSDVSLSSSAVSAFSSGAIPFASASDSESPPPPPPPPLFGSVENSAGLFPYPHPHSVYGVHPYAVMDGFSSDPSRYGAVVARAESPSDEESDPSDAFPLYPPGAEPSEVNQTSFGSSLSQSSSGVVRPQARLASASSIDRSLSSSSVSSAAPALAFPYLPSVRASSASLSSSSAFSVPSHSLPRSAAALSSGLSSYHSDLLSRVPRFSSLPPPSAAASSSASSSSRSHISEVHSDEEDEDSESQVQLPSQILPDPGFSLTQIRGKKVTNDYKNKKFSDATNVQIVVKDRVLSGNTGYLARDLVLPLLDLVGNKRSIIIGTHDIILNLSGMHSQIVRDLKEKLYEEFETDKIEGDQVVRTKVEADYYEF